MKPLIRIEYQIPVAWQSIHRQRLETVQSVGTSWPVAKKGVFSAKAATGRSDKRDLNGVNGSTPSNQAKNSPARIPRRAAQNKKGLGETPKPLGWMMNTYGLIST